MTIALISGPEQWLTTTSYEQFTTDSTVTLSDGSYVVTFSAVGADGSYDVYVQHFTANGEASAAVRVNTTTLSEQMSSNVAALDNGGYVVTWTAFGGQDGDNLAVYAQRYSAADVKLGAETLVNTTTVGGQGYPASAGLSNGGYVVAWIGQDSSSGNAVYTQRYDANGNRVGGETHIADAPVGTANCDLPSVTRVGDGYVLSWMVQTVADGWEIVLQRFSNAGAKIGAEGHVNTYTTGAQAYPEVIALGDGGYLVTWSSGGQDGSGYGVYAQRYDAAGAKSGTEFQVNSHTDNAQYVSTAAALADGGFVIVWQSAGQDLVGHGIYAQRYDSAGAPVGTEIQVNETTWRDETSPQVTALDNGGFVVSWSGYSPGNVGFMQRVYQPDVLVVTNGTAGDDMLGGHWYSDELNGLGGNDTLQGSDGNDVLNAGSGDDVLESGTGVDTIDGGSGRDILTLDRGQSTQNLHIDVTAMTTAAGAVLDDGTVIRNVEAISYMSTGSGNDELTGTAAMEVFTWSAGDGQDVLTLDYHELSENLNITVSNNFGIYWFLENHASAYGIERLALQAGSGNDTLVGTYGADQISGGSGADLITGLSGDDVLDGGAGNDTLIGGTGHDGYFIDAGDTVTEAAGGGNDTVFTAFSYTLADVNIENLTLMGMANLTATGNDGVNVLTGNSGNNRLDGRGDMDIMAGQAGNDTYVVDSILDNVGEFAGGGTDLVEASVTYSLGDNFENLTLTGLGNIWGNGNALDNSVTGNDGSNILDGRVGADTLTGGLGDDTYYIDRAEDVLVEVAGQGADTVIAALNYTLTANFENLYLAGTTTHISGTGNAAANRIGGSWGNNLLDGGLGADTLSGGLGNDTFIVDNAGDVVTELGDEGTDTVQSSVRFTLSDNIERLILTGTGNVAGIGNALANALSGNAGNNRLDGGVGADTMAGGLGDDNYVIDNAGDRVFENANEGNDSVSAAFSYSLGTQYVENLTLTGTANLSATGNALANTLIGNSGNNVLNGGNGVDKLWGGAGDDSYYVDNIADRTFEKTTSSTNAGGHDIVYASVRVTLDEFVEDLVITGTASLAGTGNALDNSLTGNSGSNALLGKDGDDILDGGAGADTMAGGLGNDTYLIDNAADRVAEVNNQGYDTIYSSVSFNLGNQYIETLTLTGTNAINGTGNGIANHLSGNDAANILDGGRGNDTLQGRGGADVFVFGLQSGVDTITDFSATDGDTINLRAYAHGVVNGGGIVIAQVAADTVITLGGGHVVTVTGATMANVTDHIVW